MNLHNIAGPCVAAVNPWIIASVQKSSGYTTAMDGSRDPTYAAPCNITVQMQPLSYKDLMQVSGLNLNGEKRAMYVNGSYDAVLRPKEKGGDLVTLPDGSKWLVVMLLENWSPTAGWSKFAVVRQL